MKAIFIIYNQGIYSEIFDLLENLNIRGFTLWDQVKGRGSETGEPRMGTHTWPALNSSLLTVVDEHKANALFEEIKKINEAVPEQGLKAFEWEVGRMF